MYICIYTYTHTHTHTGVYPDLKTVKQMFLENTNNTYIISNHMYIHTCIPISVYHTQIHNITCSIYTYIKLQCILILHIGACSYLRTVTEMFLENTNNGMIYHHIYIHKCT